MLALPFVYLVLSVITDSLGADPAKELVHSSGDFALWLLMMVMIASPMQQFLRRRELMQIRRPLGVAVFLYAAIHLLLYVLTYLELSMAALIEDLTKRPYIIAGATAFVVALLLALTSNTWSVRTLGPRWKKIHRWIYLMVVAVCVHIIWQVKFDYGEAILYSLFFFAMLLLRIPKIRSKLLSK